MIELPRRRPPNDLLPSNTAKHLIRTFEGLQLVAYRDSGGILTIGYGHTGPDVHEGLRISLGQADELFDADLVEHAQIVRDQIAVPLTQGEFDSLCAIAFNLGYIPRSMKACLNGGTTDKGIEMTPGSYGSALQQFPRNCRAAGIPLRGLLRRRLAEACVFSDLPWEGACSVNLVKLTLKAGGEIDPEETTSLQETLERARQDIPVGRVPATEEFMRAPWPEPKPVAPPTEELVLENGVKIPDEVRAAPGPAEPAAGPGPAPATEPERAPVPAKEPTTEAAAPVREVGERPVPVSPGAVPAPSAGLPRPAAPPIIPPERPKAPPVEVDTSRLQTGNMRVDQKPMEFSDRAMWFAVKMLGFWLKIMAGRGAIPLTAVSYYFDFFNDPFLSSVIITGGTWLGGQCIEAIGNWKLRRHRSTARTALV